MEFPQIVYQIWNVLGSNWDFFVLFLFNLEASLNTWALL